jgi:hypothetical protein
LPLITKFVAVVPLDTHSAAEEDDGIEATAAAADTAASISVILCFGAVCNSAAAFTSLTTLLAAFVVGFADLEGAIVSMTDYATDCLLAELLSNPNDLLARWLAECLLTVRIRQLAD